MNRRAATQITADTREEFAELCEQLSRHIDPDSDVDQAQRMLADHVPAVVVERAQLLLDTLLNYLMEDAIEALTDAPTTIKNEFYDLNLRSRVKQSFTLKSESLEFSHDPRVIAGGVAAGVATTAGGLMTALFLSGLIPRIVGGAVTLGASAVAFRIAHKSTTGTALRRLRDDVDAYMAQSEQRVAAWLANAEDFFVSAFKEFQGDKTRAKEGSA